jgi:hypothetical protein
MLGGVVGNESVSAGTAPKRRSRSGQKGKPFQPAIGKDFGNVEDVEARTRDFLARFLAVGSGLAAAVAGTYGLVTGNFTPAAAVWAVAGPIIGAVVAYYFGPQRDDRG